MIRIFRNLLLFLLAVSALVVLLFMAVKPRVEHEIQNRIRQSIGKSLEISSLQYERLSLAAAGVALHSLKVQGVSRLEHPYFDPREFDLRLERLRFSLEKISLRGISVRVDGKGLEIIGGRLLNEDENDRDRFESAAGVSGSFSFKLQGAPNLWQNQIRDQLLVLRAWVFNDQPIRGVALQGEAVFLAEDGPASVRFHSVAGPNGLVHLEGDREDLRVIAEMIEPKFTESDLDLASRNLLKAPRLLQIRRAAEQRAGLLRDRDPEIKKDTIRHIFWSYWLTQVYGADFARQATEAHETGDALNSAEESAKDRTHNQLGIEYALQNLTEAEVEAKIFEDPRVIRKKKKTAA